MHKFNIMQRLGTQLDSDQTAASKVETQQPSLELLGHDLSMFGARQGKMSLCFVFAGPSR
jgi:hypothetical protein